MNKGQRGNIRGSINQPRPLQPKTVQRQPLQPVPHINQHSVHMQRVAQAKMAQTRTAPQATAQSRNATQLKRPNRPAVSGVVQRAECFSGVIESVKSCWNNCVGSPRRDQYQEIPEMTSSSSSSSASISSSSKVTSTALRPTLVDELDTANNLKYPGTLNAGYISSCALVVFCWDDSFDCYHAKGGSYRDNHGLRSNPTQIHYVYMVSPSDNEETVNEYRRNAKLFQQKAGGGAPMTFRGQTGTNHNILLDVHSANDIRPTMGGWRM